VDGEFVEGRVMATSHVGSKRAEDPRRVDLGRAVGWKGGRGEMGRGEARGIRIQIDQQKSAKPLHPISLPT
jgi:hypothetical protein